MSYEPDWAFILGYIYDNQMKEVGASLKNHEQVEVNRHSYIQNKLQMDESEVKDAFEYMLQAGLVDAHSKGSPLRLTPRGFEVAHERRMQRLQERREDRRLERQQEFENKRVERQEKREDRRSKRQHEVNRAVAFLTLGLVAVSVLDSAVRAFVGDGEISAAYSTVLVGLVMLGSFAVILYYFGLLSPLPRGE